MIPEETVCGDVWHPPDWGFPPSRGRVNERCTQWAWFKCTNQHLSKDEPWLLSSSMSVGLIKHFLCIPLCIRRWHQRGGRLSEDGSCQSRLASCSISIACVCRPHLTCWGSAPFSLPTRERAVSAHRQQLRYPRPAEAEGIRKLPLKTHPDTKGNRSTAI